MMRFMQGLKRQTQAKRWLGLLLGGLSLTYATAGLAETEVLVSVPNFELGTRFGYLSNEQLYGLNLMINMPIRPKLTTQLAINSDYLVAGQKVESYAQSELVGNIFLRSDVGRMGLGLGYQERKFDDDAVLKQSTNTLRLFTALYLGNLTLEAIITGYERKIASLSDETYGITYFADNDHKFSLIKQRYENEELWIVDLMFQPSEYQKLASIGMQVREGDKSVYVGLSVNYYFDQPMLLRQRFRHYH